MSAVLAVSHLDCQGHGCAECGFFGTESGARITRDASQSSLARRVALVQISAARVVSTLTNEILETQVHGHTDMDEIRLKVQGIKEQLDSMVTLIEGLLPPAGDPPERPGYDVVIPPSVDVNGAGR